MTAYSVESGDRANWTLQPPSTPSARMIASAALRSRWCTASVSVWTGATTIVCLNEIGELAIRYDDYVDWLRANRDTHAHWYPIHDMHAPPVDELSELVTALRARLDNDEGIVVHCGAGIGRAGTIAAAILISHGLSVDEALTIVRASRPAAGPQTGAQERILEEYFASVND